MEIKVTDRFLRSLKRLRKKYFHISDDLLLLQNTLLANPQEGEAIPGFYNRVWKIRLASSDMTKGKSGGYRVIYYYMISSNDIYLLDIYVKTEQEDIQASEINRILEDNGLSILDV